jgi:transposase
MEEKNMTEKRAKRTYDEKFKKQLVELYKNGKPRSEIIREYDLTPSALDNWIKRINATGSSKEKDNRTPEQEELIKLRKENQRLKMENDVLKQAALILGQK